MSNDNDAITPVPPKPKTLQAMQQFSTFYNPTATNYFQKYSPDPDNATVATSNQLRRDEAESESNSEMSSRIHNLEEDGLKETASKTHDLEEDWLHNHEEMTFVVINYLPNWTFYYTCNKVAEPKPPQITTINFEAAFKHKMIEPTTFEEAYNHTDPEQRAKWHAICKEVKDMSNRGIWHKDIASSQSGC